MCLGESEVGHTLLHTVRHGETKMYSIHTLIRTLFPTACPLCGLAAAGGDLCGGCLTDLLQVSQARTVCRQCATSTSATVLSCRLCRRISPAFTYTVCAMPFAYPGDMLMRGLKERGHLSHAAVFARLLGRAVIHHQPALPILHALVPIPSGRASLRRRGFNPAAEIARELSRSLRIPLRQDLLRRTHEVSLQKTLGLAARRKSVEGLYACDASLAGRWVGVVDDVMTTGSTLHAASWVLQQAGAQGVVALVGARTPRRPRTPCA